MTRGNKSDPQGGQRTAGRHVSELGVGGALALFIVSLLPDAWLDPFQMNLLGVILTGAFSTIAKILHARGLLGELTRSGLVLALLISIGCAGQVGTITPEFRTGADGETIVACTIKGVSISWGDSDICRNVEGGHVGRDFVGMFLGVVQIAVSAVGGIFSGLGGVGASMQAVAVAPPPALPPAEATPPTITGGEPASPGTADAGWFD